MLVLEEHWRGRLWSAIPHRYVGGDATTVITHVPYGTTGTLASSRGLPAASGLTTGAGKLRTLATLEYRVLELPANPPAASTSSGPTGARASTAAGPRTVSSPAGT